MTFDTLLSQIQITRTDHLPIVAAFCRRVKMIEVIDRVVPTKMDVSVGTIIQGMVLDTLSGRSPLYRLSTFFENQDTELLLGKMMPAGVFNDTTVARAMDAVFDRGAEKAFSAVAFQAACEFPLDKRHVHFDTTSVNVWGDYDRCRPDTGKLNITYGYSKDHRPDLKQFLIKLLCIERNIPIIGSCKDGNASDKALNNTLLNRISRHMAKYGLKPGAFIYIADSAMVTEDNLSLIGENLFLTRLPFSYNETSRVVSEAVAEKNWELVGALNQTPVTAKRPAANYSIAEKTVTLYGKKYRAVVVHSTAHDKRRLKRIDREIKRSKTTMTELISKETKQEFFCYADAEVVASNLRKTETELHLVTVTVTEKIQYVRGRPPKTGPRKVASTRYVLKALVEEKTEQIKRKRKEAGCFVLLSNVPQIGEMAETTSELLRDYKNQHGIERNFSFLKDPMIVNAIFLKKPERIEVLGAVLLLSLLIWNLIEYVLRQHIKKYDEDLPGWDNKPTRRPTAFMMSTKFIGTQFVTIDGVRRIATPFTNVQQKYLAALGISEDDLLCPSSQPRN